MSQKYKRFLIKLPIVGLIRKAKVNFGECRLQILVKLLFDISRLIVSHTRISVMFIFELNMKMVDYNDRQMSAFHNQLNFIVANFCQLLNSCPNSIFIIHYFVILCKNNCFQSENLVQYYFTNVIKSVKVKPCSIFLSKNVHTTTRLQYSSTTRPV